MKSWKVYGGMLLLSLSLTTPLYCETLTEQIDGLIDKCSETCGVDRDFVEELWKLSGGTALYLDKTPDIYKDETVKSAKAPMSLDGVNVQYREAPFCDDTSRIMAYYLPDAMYSVVSDISDIMQNRRMIDRGAGEVYFNSLRPEIRERILFYEAVLTYLGVDKKTVDGFQGTYEAVLFAKENDENVTKINDTGDVVIKDKFLKYLTDAGFTNQTALKYLAVLFSNDSWLAKNDNIENLRDAFVLPYKPNTASYENLMLAGASLCGKVRYVWGGGHSGASYIDGINPVWSAFNDCYTDEHLGSYIGSHGGWCPEHGVTDTEFHGGVVTSLEEYVDLKANTLDASQLLEDKYREMLSQVDYSEGINTHTLDGLDCSGFASWLYNQATDEFNVNSTAVNFTNQSKIKALNFGTALLPGDVFAWTEHIVVVVGKVKDNSKVYVTIESTPPVLRYGVIYYKGASQADIRLAKQIAEEANLLIGGIDFEPHCYCMNEQGYFHQDAQTVTVTEYSDGTVDGEVPETYDFVEDIEIESGVEHIYTIQGELSGQIAEVGRLDVEYSDTWFSNLTAQEIIQRVLKKLPVSYVEGYDRYNGELFDKSAVASAL